MYGCVVSFGFRRSMNSVTQLYWSFWIPLNYILTLNNFDILVVTIYSLKYTHLLFYSLYSC